MENSNTNLKPVYWSVSFDCLFAQKWDRRALRHVPSTNERAGYFVRFHFVCVLFRLETDWCVNEISRIRQHALGVHPS